MSILKQVAEEELGTTFTHSGWLFLCPVYLRFDDDGFVLQERNWIPGWWLRLNTLAHALCITLCSLNPKYVPEWMVWGIREYEADMLEFEPEVEDEG